MTKVIKRNGEVVDYDGNKIILAISKAMAEGTGINEEIAEEIENVIYDEVSSSDGMYTVEAINDLIEINLMKYGKYNTAKRFILYRDKRKENREKGWNMTELQRDIFKQKYEYKNEGFEGFLDRVSNGNDKIKKLIRDKKFIPAGRILANRGLHKHGQKVTLSNCYVLSEPEDNIESIFKTAGKLARTFSYGG